MPTNKNAQLRYQILDRCFSDFKNKYSIDDLLEEVNETLYEMYGAKSTVAVRQIRADICFMRDSASYNAPIMTYPLEGKKMYYRYEDRDFSIFNNELSVEDVNTLRSTIEMLGKYRNAAGNAWLEEVISNLEYRFGVKSNNENVVSFEQNSQLKGLEFLSGLIDAAVNHSPLEIVYRTYKGVEKTSVVHPYHLKQYNNRWFIFGLEESDKFGNYLTNMALDRIVKFTLQPNVKFIPNKDIDFASYFNDIVGVTIPNDKQIEEVVLKFDDARFPYIISKPIHSSQQIVSEDEHTISIYVIPNKELESQILSYGPQVEVLNPTWFRDQIAKKICETNKKYFAVQNDHTDSL